MTNESPLLKLLNQRKSWEGPPHHRPVLTAQYRNSMMQAARQHARAFNSDPFALQRALLYISQGYDLPSDMNNDATNIIKRREYETHGMAQT